MGHHVICQDAITETLATIDYTADCELDVCRDLQDKIFRKVKNPYTLSERICIHLNIQVHNHARFVYLAMDFDRQ